MAMILIVVLVYLVERGSSKLIKCMKNKARQDRIEFKNTTKNLKGKLPGLFKNENWKVKSYESAIYKPTNELFSWGEDYEGGFIFEFSQDINGLLTEDEKYILYCFLDRLTNSCLKNGNLEGREDLINKYS
jgi:hypothetical protein